MRIAESELRHLAFESDVMVDVKRRGIRVMRLGDTRELTVSAAAMATSAIRGNLGAVILQFLFSRACPPGGFDKQLR